MLNTGVLSLSVFSDGDDVHIVVRGLEALNRFAWPNIGKEIELSESKSGGQLSPNRCLKPMSSLSEGKIERLMALANWSGQWALQSNLGGLDRVDCLLRYSELAISSSDRSDINGFLERSSEVKVMQNLTSDSAFRVLTHSIGASAASKIFITLAEISLPMPSPGISVTLRLFRKGEMKHFQPGEPRKGGICKSESTYSIHKDALRWLSCVRVEAVKQEFKVGSQELVSLFETRNQGA